MFDGLHLHFSANLNKDARRLVTGLWLEHYVFLEVARLIKKRNVDSGNRFQAIPGFSSSFLNQTDKTHEVDVLLLDRETPHFIEVKTYRNNKKDETQKWLDRAQAVKRALGGDPAGSWVVLPFMSYEGESGLEHQRKAKERGVTLLYGPNAVADLLKSLEVVMRV